MIQSNDPLADLRGIKFPFNIDEVKEECHNCVRKQLKKYEKMKDPYGKSMKGQFIVPCTGIPANPVDPDLLAMLPNQETRDQIEELQDIVKWASANLKLSDGSPWNARWYQANVLRCTSRRKVLRISRRAGKTDSVCVEICYYLFTQPNIKLVVAGPQKTHAEEIFNRVREFIRSNPQLANMVTRDVSAPWYEIILTNGARLRGFAAGAKGKGSAVGIRGQDADRLYLEEMDYVDENAITGAVLPILQTTPNTALVGFSTPSGFRTPYYECCEEDPQYVEFHFSYKVLPHWKAVEADKPRFTEEKWTHEFLAEWGSSEDGVYKPEYIDAALTTYDYKDMRRNPNWRYCIGTDWNEKHGTEIVVVGYDTTTKTYKVVESVLVPGSEFTQLSGIARLLEMNRKWKPNYIYIDAGNGCLHKDTLVYTSDRVKKIKDISIGDYVLTHNGVYKEVINAVYTGIKNSFKIKPAFGLPTIASDCHTHIVYRSNERFKDFNDISSADKFCSTDLNLKELRTDELNKKKDFFLVPKEDISKARKSLIVDLVEELKDVKNLQFDNKYIWTTHGFSTSETTSNSFLMQKYNTSRATVQRMKRKLKNKEKMAPAEIRLFKRLVKDYGDDWHLRHMPKHKKIKRYIDILDPLFLNLYGWYLSEGHAGVNNIEICQMPFHYKKEFKSLINYCSSQWDCNVLIRKNGMQRLFILSSLLTKFFKKIGGSHCYNKFIDKRILDNNGIGLLPSLFWGDGHEHKHGLNLSLTSDTLIMQVRQMLINNGVMSGLHRINPRKREDGYKDSARQLMLYVNGNQYNYKRINNLLKSNIVPREGVFRRKYIEIDNCFLIPIKEIKYIGETEDMYDLTVKDDASFCANGFATHNSTNYELLRKTSFEERRPGGDRDTARLLDILKRYDAGSSIPTQDPVTGSDIRMPAKPFMINASVRMFEQKRIKISSYDDVLEKQMRAYIIERYTPTKTPVYGLNDDRVGDHRLDALNLALVAFHLEFDDLHVVTYLTNVAAVPDPRTHSNAVNTRPTHISDRETRPEDRRLEGPVESSSRFGILPGKVDFEYQFKIKTNRPGWDYDRESEEKAKHLQRIRSRGTVQRNRPTRSTF